ncbi:hypothetical protein L6N65_001960 [Escherichia coli]|nr:hypothetical protein [Escherichia coli]EIV8346733.1 hypothetical protein [Escherichia coli]EKS5495582.1 hypothetical protein [Escherichia coli]ELD0455543.1 hypothetical protein [Escherichia coli]ELO3285841.1 hypothetical protein [Escherichia coli]
MKALNTLLVITFFSACFSVSAASFTAGGSSFNDMGKADKAAARHTSLSTFNTASRAAAIQSTGIGDSAQAVANRTAAMAADHAAKLGAQAIKANQTRTQQQIDANNDAARGASLTAQAQQRNVTPVGISVKNMTMAQTATDANALAAAQLTVDTAYNARINQRAVDISPETQVTKTDGTVTTAGEIAKITPQAQISVGLNSPFSPATRKGGNSNDRGNGSNVSGTGNGGSNAQNSRSAGGLADSHVGGGRVGGGFHY